MGLLKAGMGAVGGALADQWLEFFYCDAIPADTLVVKGQKRTGDRSSNTKGTDNIISNGSTIAIADGQCMIIVDQGKVADVCSEPGEYKYDTSTEPSIFAGNLGETIIESFKSIGKRFAQGGEPAKDQRVYYVNTKEIIDNKYGTPNPVPFRVVDKNIGLDVDIAIRCNGVFSYKVVDPILFYTNVCGNVDGEYKRDNIDSMLKTELLTALQPVFAKISEQGIRYSALPGHTTEIADALNQELSAKWKDLRGIVVASFGINSVNASKEDEDMIKQLQKTAVNRDPNMAAATIVTAQSDAMRAAASNDNGAMMGFMGMGMAQQSGGVNAQGLFQMGQEQQAQQQAQTPAAPAPAPVAAPAPEAPVAAPAPAVAPTPAPAPAAADGWTCACGATNTSNFCAECGKPKPVAAPEFACNKCGWTPADPTAPPKFCPECGDVFDDGDKK